MRLTSALVNLKYGEVKMSNVLIVDGNLGRHSIYGIVFRRLERVLNKSISRILVTTYESGLGMVTRNPYDLYIIGDCMSRGRGAPPEILGTDLCGKIIEKEKGAELIIMTKNGDVAKTAQELGIKIATGMYDLESYLRSLFLPQ